MSKVVLKSLGDAAAGWCSACWFVAALYTGNWGAWGMFVLFAGLVVMRAVPDED